MHDSIAVRARKCVGELDQNLMCFVCGKPASPAQQICQCLTTYVAHDEIPHATQLAERVELQNARVRKIGGDSCFPPESLAALKRCSQLGAQHLDRDEPLERSFAGEIDRSHSSATNLADDLVLMSKRETEQLGDGISSRRRVVRRICQDISEWRRPLCGMEERVDLSPERGVVTAQFVDERLPLL